MGQKAELKMWTGLHLKWKVDRGENSEISCYIWWLISSKIIPPRIIIPPDRQVIMRKLWNCKTKFWPKRWQPQVLVSNSRHFCTLCQIIRPTMRKWVQNQGKALLRTFCSRSIGTTRVSALLLRCQITVTCKQPNKMYAAVLVPSILPCWIATLILRRPKMANWWTREWSW